MRRRGELETWWRFGQDLVKFLVEIGNFCVSTSMLSTLSVKKGDIDIEKNNYVSMVETIPMKRFLYSPIQERVPKELL